MRSITHGHLGARNADQPPCTSLEYVVHLKSPILVAELCTLRDSGSKPSIQKPSSGGNATDPGRNPRESAKGLFVSISQRSHALGPWTHLGQSCEQLEPTLRGTHFMTMSMSHTMYTWVCFSEEYSFQVSKGSQTESPPTVPRHPASRREPGHHLSWQENRPWNSLKQIPLDLTH